MVVKYRVLFISFLIWLIGVCLLTFHRYYKVIREQENIVFIRYQYGFPTREVASCPLESADSIRICLKSGPNSQHLIYTQKGKEHSLIQFCTNSCRRGSKTLRWSVHDYDIFIHKIRELASKGDRENFYYIPGLTTPHEFIKTVLVCLIIAGGVGVAMHKL